MNAPHQDDLEGVPHVSMDCGFLGETESEDRVSPVLVIRERRHKMTWATLFPRKDRSFLGSLREQSPARRKDIVLVGGVCGILDEQVPHRQGRQDTAAKTARAKGQHTDPGVWREDPAHACQTSEVSEEGAAVPPRSVCWHAELVVTGSGCHRAGIGDQDKVDKHQ